MGRETTYKLIPTKQGIKCKGPCKHAVTFNLLEERSKEKDVCRVNSISVDLVYTHL